MIYYHTFLPILLSTLCVFNVDSQSLTGIVYDELNLQPLSEATIGVVGSKSEYVTDSSGRYKITDIEVGRISITIEHLGYESRKINNIWIKSGIGTNKNFFLSKQFIRLDEVVISPLNNEDHVGKISITEEQINRFASTYYDPARVLTTVPDIAVTNDQNNQVSVRGISPDYNVWRLEGAEIVNPNHLSNAGTFTDQASATGGGVNMLSAQMLSRSDFLYSSMDNEYGNTVGGLFDMQLKNGNSRDRKFTAQASLIGFDLASEGPFKHNGKLTYAVNYRYSFTGLLSRMGVKLGDESIGFQDITFTIHSPVGSRASIKFYGIGGASFNDFSHKPLENSVVLKDRQDIFYQNRTGIAGLSYKQGLNHGNLAVTLAYSTTKNDRKQNMYALWEDELISETQTRYETSIMSLATKYKQQLGNSILSAGIMANKYTFGYSQEKKEPLNEVDTHYLSPYTQIEIQLIKALEGKVGISASYNFKKWVIEPRVELEWQFDESHAIGMAAGSYSQLITPFNFYFSNPYGIIPQDFIEEGELSEFIRSSRLLVNHKYQNKSFSISTEMFYYYFPSVNTISKQNHQEKASTYGISSMLDKAFTNEFYARIGGSIFNSQINDIDNYYNAQYSLNLAAGKDWNLTSSKGDHMLSFNLKCLYQGAYYPYYTTTIQNPDGTISTERNYYDLQPFFRIDGRIAWVQYKENSTWTLALDLQNLANVKNESFRQFNPYSGEWEMQYQLGILPILAYKVEW